MFQHTLTTSLKKGFHRNFLTNTARFRSVTSVEVSQKIENKNLGAQKGNVNATNWDKALPYKNLPGPKSIPILGNMWRFLPGIGEFYNVPLPEFHNMLQEQYGNVVKLSGIFGREDIVFIFDPDDIEMLLRNEGSWPNRRSLLSFVHYRTVTRKDIFKECGGILTVQGEEWFKVRSKVNPILMQPKVVQNLLGHVDEVAKEFINNIRYFSTLNDKKEMPENFINEINKWGLESMGVLTLNKHLGCLNVKEINPEIQKLIDSVLEMFDLMYKLDVLPSMWQTFSTPTWKRYVQVLDFITNKFLAQMEEALEKMETSDPDEVNILQKLMKLDKQVALAMVMDMLVAGIDTTAKTLGATLYFLAKNTEKQELLHKELLENMPSKDSPVTKEILAKCPYLKAVIKETTRMAPIAVGNLRSLDVDMVLAGYQIPKNTDILTVQLKACQSEQHFKHADKYIPERWLRTTTDELSHKNVHPFVFLPFGFGPRSCVGKRLANLELEVVLAKIIRNFKLTWPHEDMVFSATLLYGIKSPLKICVNEADD